MKKTYRKLKSQNNTVRTDSPTTLLHVMWKKRKERIQNIQELCFASLSIIKCAWWRLRLNVEWCTGCVRRTLCLSVFGSSFQADFPLFHLIKNPVSPLLVSGSMHAGSFRWTLKWAHRCTSNKISHTSPVCQEENGWKKSFSPHPDRVHSDPPAVSSSILLSTSQMCGSAVPLHSAHQWNNSLETPYELFHKL